MVEIYFADGRKMSKWSKHHNGAYILPKIMFEERRDIF